MIHYRLFSRLHRCLFLIAELINELNLIRRDIDPQSLDVFTECLGYAELNLPALTDLLDIERRCKK